MVSISIVGNGPLSQENGDLIDSADIVLRFNRARACGAAGRRVDILVINRSRVYMSKRINPLALDRAGEVWINDAEANGRVDWLFEQECKPKYLGLGPMQKVRAHLERYAPEPGYVPTTGVCIIAELLETQPEASLSLFGFTHEGMHTHDMDAEKKWINDLVVDGRISRYPAEGMPARFPVAEKAEYLLRFAEKRTKHYIQNKIVHSSTQTKKRIFGR